MAGIFAWNALSGSVANFPVFFPVAVLFDFWPISTLKLKPHTPGFAAVATLCILALAAIMFTAFTVAGGMDLVKYLVLVPVPFIFGFFIVVPLLHKCPFAHLRRPGAGFALAIFAALAGLAMYTLYRYLAPVVTGGPLASGPPTYDLELWLASAMLAMTFPLIVFPAALLDLWPFKRMEGTNG